MHSKIPSTIPEEIGRFVHTYFEKIRPALEHGNFEEARDYMFPVFMRRGLFVDSTRTSQDVSKRTLNCYFGALKYLEAVYRDALEQIEESIVPIVLRHVDKRVKLIDDNLKKSGLYQLTRNRLI